MKLFSVAPLSEYVETNKRKNIINWIAIAILMIFYAGTWLFPYFYHITEIYNTSIVFAALTLLFFNNIDFVNRLKHGEKELYVLGLACVTALVNLFIIGSNKGCILILTDFLLVWYLGSELKLTARQLEFMCAVFVIVFLVWFGIDLAFSYNSNTGASVTTFTFMCASVYLTRLSQKKEIFGLIMVMCYIRLINLILWHLARGAFMALLLFAFFYYIAPRKWWANKGTFYLLCLVSTLGSLLFVFSYVALAATGVNFQMPFFYKSLFSGREQIWLEIWNMLRTRLLTGIGSGFKLESFFEYNIHNVMYDILAVHGIIVFALALYLILKRMFMMRNVFARAQGESLRLSVLAAGGIFAIALESFIDMDLMWADYSPVLLFLLMVVFRDRDKLKGRS